MGKRRRLGIVMIMLEIATLGAILLDVKRQGRVSFVWGTVCDRCVTLISQT
ncbi:hypothetical protein [Arcanobacterium haemolyticum]|uniref:hypothetical protein n=1 Tax=Arcanobacterium haemolyticum TaxID=28264 RepID=UPI0015EC4A1B|nr:hypothetical protein [Arcanobacterium haemolyticum]